MKIDQADKVKSFSSTVIHKIINRPRSINTVCSNAKSFLEHREFCFDISIRFISVSISQKLKKTPFVKSISTRSRRKIFLILPWLLKRDLL